MHFTKYAILDRSSDNRWLLLNTLTGDHLKLNEAECKEISSLMKGEKREIESDLEKNLKEKNFLLTSVKKELELISHFKRDFFLMKENKPVVFGICLTYDCNAKCIYCYENGVKRKKDKMSVSDIHKIFSAMEYFTAYNLGTNIRIFLEGGEPFLPENEKILKKAFYQISQYKKKYPLTEIYIFTNGINTLQYLDLLKEYKYIISDLLITLIGNEELHNAYRPTLDGSNGYVAVINTINTLLANRIGVRIVLNINKQNIFGIKDLLRIKNENQWEYSDMFHGFYPSRIKYLTCYNNNEINEAEAINLYQAILQDDPSNIEKLDFGDFRTLKNVQKFVKAITDNKIRFQQFESCSGSSLRQFLFDPHGEIYTCTKVTGRAKYSIGKFKPYLNLNPDMIRWWKDRTCENIKKCQACNLAYICGGNCAYEAIEKNKDMHTPSCPPVSELLKTCLEQNFNNQNTINQNDIVY